MSRKVNVMVTVNMNLIIDEGVEVNEILREMDYEFTETTTKATIEDHEIVDWEVIDSR
jgi:hypothetical protein